MNSYVYIQYFLGQLLILCLGYNLINRVLIGYLTGLFSLAIILPILIRFVPGYVYNFIYLILILNFIYFLFKKKHIEFFFKIKKSFKYLIIFILINIFFIIFFKDFHFKNFIYEAHDIVYWSPSIELYYSDYIGNIRNFTYYPSELTGHPLFPTSILSTASIFITNLTLIPFLEVRYLLICNILMIACYLFYQTNKNYKKINYIYYFLLFIILMYSFENFIAYSLLFSGIFATLIFILFLVNFENTDETSIKFNSYLSLFLLVTKPGIVFIFLIFPVYYFFKYKIVRKDILFYILTLFIFLNMLSWILIDAPAGNAGLALFNPFKLSDYYQTLLMSSWIPLGSIFQNLELLANKDFILNFGKDETSLANIFEAYKLQKDKVNLIIFKFLIIFLFFFLVPFILILKNYKKNHVYSYFLIFSFIITIFLRNENIFGNKTIEQVVHIIFLMPIFLTYLLLKSFLIKENLKFCSIIIVSIILLFSNFKLNYASKVLDNRAKSPESVSYSKFLEEKDNYNINNNYLTNTNFNSKADVDKTEIYSLMLGKRIRENEYDKYDEEYRPSMLPWSIPRYHNFIADDQLMKKNAM
jgi:hypothetical protein